MRREHERFVVELQVSVHSEHNLYAGLAENISAGGLFIATHQLQPVGSRIELSLRMPDSEDEFQIVGEVRWVRVYNEHSDTPPGFGVRFTELPPALPRPSVAFWASASRYFSTTNEPPLRAARSFCSSCPSSLTACMHAVGDRLVHLRALALIEQIAKLDWRAEDHEDVLPGAIEIAAHLLASDR